MNTHVHIIGIGGIGISALARYYRSLGYTVSGSDDTMSALIRQLQDEGMHISIGHHEKNIPAETSYIVYSEAIITQPDKAPHEQLYANPELAAAKNRGIRHISYPVALGEVFDVHYGIAIAGSHGKSTTTSMTAVMLA